MFFDCSCMPLHDRFTLLLIYAAEEGSDEYLNEDQSPNVRIHRSMSAVDHAHIHSLQNTAALASREIRSAGMRTRRGAICNVLPLCLPEHTLRVTLDEVAKCKAGFFCVLVCCTGSAVYLAGRHIKKSRKLDLN